MADGLGCLLLPDTDTLRQVLRVRRDQYIGQTYYANRHSTPCIDSIPHLSDTIQVWLQRDPATWHVVHCQWYAPGYRYPVFETFENSIYKSGILHKHFNTSFYYPLTEQQYLKDDPENRAIRENSRTEFGKQSFRIKTWVQVFSVGLYVGSRETIDTELSNE